MTSSKTTLATGGGKATHIWARHITPMDQAAATEGAAILKLLQIRPNRHAGADPVAIRLNIRPTVRVGSERRALR